MIGVGFEIFYFSIYKSWHLIVKSTRIQLKNALINPVMIIRGNALQRQFADITVLIFLLNKLQKAVPFHSGLYNKNYLLWKTIKKLILIYKKKIEVLKNKFILLELMTIRNLKISTNSIALNRIIF